ncbi:hypothetical protein M513_06202 [Trichuris suis]|uniref:Uncharacterized protein n=1 Tax=Trichuris suis TaxID=68888 RepID=A0A085M6P6_9BILA|nr:hypothetical protein M513_06202 [Trichuris suis]
MKIQTGIETPVSMDTKLTNRNHLELILAGRQISNVHDSHSSYGPTAVLLGVEGSSSSSAHCLLVPSFRDCSCPVLNELKYCDLLKLIR